MLSTTTPSTTYSGETPSSLKVEAPRIDTNEEEPGAPEFDTICIPGAAPCNASKTFTEFFSSKILESTEVIEPVICFLFISFLSFYEMCLIPDCLELHAPGFQFFHNFNLFNT